MCPGKKNGLQKEIIQCNVLEELFREVRSREGAVYHDDYVQRQVGTGGGPTKSTGARS